MGAGAGKLRSGAIVLSAALLTPLAIANAVAPLYTLCALLALAALAADRAWRDIPRAPALLAICLLGWAGLSIAWSADPARSARALASLALSLAGGLALLAAADRASPTARARAGTALVAGLALTLGLLAIEAVPRYLRWTPTPLQWLLDAAGMKFGLSSLNRAASLVAICVWPAAAIVLRRHGWRRAWILPAAALAVLPALESGAAQLAMICALGAGAVTAWRPGATRAILPAAAVLGILAMPLVTGSQAFRDRFAARDLPVSVWHRAEIWAFAARHVAARPLTGWGLDTTRELPGAADLVDGKPEYRPMHTHNNPLQLWLELGAVGALLGAAAAVLAARAAAAARLDMPARLGAVAALCAALAICATGFGMWQGWWMGSLWIVAALIRATAATSGETARA